MIKKPVYIHYGDDLFRTPNPIRNIDLFTKPHGGLWASRKDDEFGWKDWCEMEEFRLDEFDRSFEFSLKDSARILVLENLDQLDNLPKTNDTRFPYKKGDGQVHAAYAGSEVNGNGYLRGMPEPNEQHFCRPDSGFHGFQKGRNY